MWDMKTGRTRGYGFVAYRDRGDAEKALSSMDGEWLGSRAIRCNWANQKGQPSVSQQQAMAQMGLTPTTPFGHHQYPTNGQASYEMVVNQTPHWQTTVYVGNLTPYTTQNDLIPLFQNFGYVVETRFQSDRGFAFVKMDTHENAANSICSLQGYNVNGRPLKCSVSVTSGRSLMFKLTQTCSGAKIVHLQGNSMATPRRCHQRQLAILSRLQPPSSRNTVPPGCLLKVRRPRRSTGTEVQAATTACLQVLEALAAVVTQAPARTPLVAMDMEVTKDRILGEHLVTATMKSVVSAHINATSERVKNAILIQGKVVGWAAAS